MDIEKYELEYIDPNKSELGTNLAPGYFADMSNAGGGITSADDFFELESPSELSYTEHLTNPINTETYKEYLKKEIDKKLDFFSQYAEAHASHHKKELKEVVNVISNITNDINSTGPGSFFSDEINVVQKEVESHTLKFIACVPEHTFPEIKAQIDYLLESFPCVYEKYVGFSNHTHKYFWERPVYDPYEISVWFKLCVKEKDSVEKIHTELSTFINAYKKPYPQVEINNNYRYFPRSLFQPQSDLVSIDWANRTLFDSSGVTVSYPNIDYVPVIHKPVKLPIKVRVNNAITRSRVKLKKEGFFAKLNIFKRNTKVAEVYTKNIWYTHCRICEELIHYTPWKIYDNNIPRINPDTERRKVVYCSCGNKHTRSYLFPDDFIDLCP